MVIFLHQLAAPGIILQDLLVVHTRQELVRHARVDPHNMRRLARSELVDALSSLGIPKLHVPVVTGRDELRATGVEVDVVHGLGMARVRPQQLPLMVYIPYSNL
jgi:hypothetical protein